MSEYPPEITPTAEDEYIARMLLLMKLQSVYRASVETDDNSLKAAIKTRQAGMSMEAEVFVSPQFTEHDALPGSSYDRMIWKPKPDQDVYGLEKIVARLPIPAPTFEDERMEDQAFLKEPSTMPVWNDIFLEVTYKEDTFQRVLLNSRGVVPYRDKSDIDELKEETQDPNQRGPVDHFRVTAPGRKSVPLTADTLTTLIRSCNLQRQKRQTGKD